MKKPIIGITCNYDYSDIFIQSNELGNFNPKWHYISECYTNSVEEAGGIPLLIPIYKNKEDLLNILNIVDGVLISDGNDINPLEYGEIDCGKCGRIIPERDKQDIDIVKYIVGKTSKPMLCICRGTQILNVALGGSLYQDLESEKSYCPHMKNNYPMNTISHRICIENDSLLFEILNSNSMGVNSLHHQAIKNVGENLKPIAKSEDNVIEATELQNSSFVLGLQWHPEKMYDNEEQKKIFKVFIEKCKYLY